MSRSSPEALAAIARSWFVRRHPTQEPPLEPFHTWLMLGGRGAGKTRAGAELIRSLTGPGVRMALVGATLNDVREVMIEGPSGLRAIAPKAERPSYEVSRRRLRWPDGALAYAFSAAEPERLRGPQFHAAWCDEFCAWKKPADTLALLRMGLRLGPDPRLVITTTPKPIGALRRLMAEPGVVTTRAPTLSNAAHLSPGFLATLEGLYGGTALAQQEMEGQVVEGHAAALWTAEQLARLRSPWPERWDRCVVGVDPAVSGHGDACGIIAVCRVEDRCIVLADRSTRGVGWPHVVTALAEEIDADEIVVEANQGGELVRQVLSQSGCSRPVSLQHARLGKTLRAEPVAHLYDRGRVTHAGAFPLLEEEMMALGSPDLVHSPDRADALVWAVWALMLRDRKSPRVRGV